MPSTKERLQRLARDAGFAAKIAAAALSIDRPVLCFLTVTRRCNLSCGYCFEYDDWSPPVPYERLQASIQHLARLRTVMVTLNGGEPLLHPRAAELARLITDNGMVAGLITNGFLLTTLLIEQLNDAGLFVMQLSIDSVVPNATTQKSLKTLRGKLELLAKHARFRVRVNSVLGSAPAEQAEEVARVVLEYGFDTKSALVRSSDGSPVQANRELRDAAARVANLDKGSLGLLGEDFQTELSEGATVEWRCRAGARYFHVCERGLVHLCGPKLHTGTIPLLAYTVEDIRREFQAIKPCTAHCAVAYAHQVSQLDAFRPQTRPAAAATPAAKHTRLPVIGDQ